MCKQTLNLALTITVKFFYRMQINELGILKRICFLLLLKGALISPWSMVSSKFEHCSSDGQILKLSKNVLSEFFEGIKFLFIIFK